MVEYGDKARMQYVVGVHVCVCLGEGEGNAKRLLCNLKFLSPDSNNGQ